MEEMGFVTELEELFHFIYIAPFDNGLTEHEFDHVMIGHFNDAPQINPEEVASYKWMTALDIKEDMIQQPEIYTEWFKIIFEKYYTHIS
jgi:isopentenyl-diphosphate delta-isomerase